MTIEKSYRAFESVLDYMAFFKESYEKLPESEPLRDEVKTLIVEQDFSGLLESMVDLDERVDSRGTDIATRCHMIIVEGRPGRSIAARHRLTERRPRAS